LDDLAALLDTPDNWEERYNHVTGDGHIFRKLSHFRDLSDDTAEATIQSKFIGIVEAIAHRRGVELESDTETKIIVGGILARNQYELRSKTSPHFFSITGLNWTDSEAKTHRNYAPGDMWYHCSRGIQTLSALYAFNCPTFLFSQRQWKLFVEHTERNAVLTFPYMTTSTIHLTSTPVWFSQWAQHFSKPCSFAYCPYESLWNNL
jgi:hypothetical protein